MASTPAVTTAALLIVSAIESCVSGISDAKSVAFRREKAFALFHEVAITVLPLYWETILLSVGDVNADRLFTQSVNQKVFDAVFGKRMTGGDVRDELAPSMSDTETNALRYMCGYVPFALLKKYRALGKEEGSAKRIKVAHHLNAFSRIRTSKTIQTRL